MLSSSSGRLVRFLNFMLCGILLLTYCSLYSQNNFGKLKRDDAAKLLAKYISFQSVQGNEGDAGRFLSKICSDNGLNVKVFSEVDSAYNFAASLYPLSSKKPNIIFLNHIDVVPANDSADWKYPPFSGSIVNNEIWGRGSVDMKGQAIMQLMALLDYADSAKTKDYLYNITLLSVSGEETNPENGSQMIADKFITDLNPVAVFGEGGSGVKNFLTPDTAKSIFGISVAEKSVLWLKLDVYSESFGHGAAPSELYANKKLLRALIKLLNEKKYSSFGKLQMSMFHQLGDLQGGLKGFIIKHINWAIFWPFVKKQFAEGQPLNLLVYNTFSITNISNPKGASNQIAEKASAVLDYRLLPGIDTAKFIHKIKNTVGPKVKISVISSSPDALPTPQDKFYDALSAALKEKYSDCLVMPILFPATTDNNYFRNKGIHVFGIVPVILSQEALQSIHNKNEKLPVQSLYDGIEVFRNFIGKVFSGKF